MATIAFPGTVERNVGDERDLFFTWPSASATFTHQYSLDGGLTFLSGTANITERNIDGFVDYVIPWVAEERPSSAGILLIIVDDGTDSGRIEVNYTESSSSDEAQTEFGPKRVRTKEMEIEQFDPLKIKQLQEREELVSPPLFGELPGSRGVPSTYDTYQ